jgi:hypothetical protein
MIRNLGEKCRNSMASQSIVNPTFSNNRAVVLKTFLTVARIREVEGLD